MGYRSDVGIVVWAEEPDVIDELLAVYAMMPSVQKHGGADALGWERFETKIGEGLRCYFEDVKWYQGYDDVQATEDMFGLVTAFYEERGVVIGARFIRVGEDANDIVECDYGDPDIYLGDFMVTHTTINFYNFKIS